MVMFHSYAEMPEGNSCICLLVTGLSPMCLGWQVVAVPRATLAAVASGGALQVDNMLSILPWQDISW